MTLANPIVVTINAVDKTMPKINTDAYGSHYRLVSSTERFDLKIRHSAGKPKGGVVTDNHNVELTQTVFATEPGDPDTVYRVYVVIQNPANKVGVEAPRLAVGLADLLKISGLPADLLAWQN